MAVNKAIYNIKLDLETETEERKNESISVISTTAFHLIDVSAIILSRTFIYFTHLGLRHILQNSTQKMPINQISTKRQIKNQ